jgi:hypothetical protein
MSDFTAALIGVILAFVLIYIYQELTFRKSGDKKIIGG